jgi:ankyrin repeat protein
MSVSALLELSQLGAVDKFTAAWRASGLGIDCAEPETDVTALLVAAEHGHRDMVRQLIELRADVTRASSSGNTALHFAARGPNTAILALLHDAGANCAAQNKNGDTPLLQAVAAGQLESVAWLIDVASKDAAEGGGGGGSGVGSSKVRRRPNNIFGANRHGMTPAMLAAARANPHMLALLLRDAPAAALDLGSQDKDGYAALHHAARNSGTGAADCVHALLLAPGTELMAKDRKGMTAHQVASAAHADACAAVFAAHLRGEEERANALMRELQEEENCQAQLAKGKGKGKHNSMAYKKTSRSSPAPPVPVTDAEQLERAQSDRQSCSLMSGQTSPQNTLQSSHHSNHSSSQNTSQSSSQNTEQCSSQSTPQKRHKNAPSQSSSQNTEQGSSQNTEQGSSQNTDQRLGDGDENGWLCVASKARRGRGERGERGGRKGAVRGSGDAPGAGGGGDEAGGKKQRDTGAQGGDIGKVGRVGKLSSLGVEKFSKVSTLTKKTGKSGIRVLTFE